MRHCFSAGLALVAVPIIFCVWFCFQVAQFSGYFSLRAFPLLYSFPYMCSVQGRGMGGGRVVRMALVNLPDCAAILRPSAYRAASLRSQSRNIFRLWRCIWLGAFRFRVMASFSCSQVSPTRPSPSVLRATSASPTSTEH